MILNQIPDYTLRGKTLWAFTKPQAGLSIGFIE